VTPCRVVDTRKPVGPYGGPALVAGADRTFVFAGQCGIPITAKAVALDGLSASLIASGLVDLPLKYVLAIDFIENSIPLQPILKQRYPRVSILRNFLAILKRLADQRTIHTGLAARSIISETPVRPVVEDFINVGIYLLNDF